MQDPMSKPEFNCDREWWSSLTEAEQDHWLDWAESCGADREVNLVGRNEHYPDLICMPSVSLGIVNLSDEELDTLLNICDNPPEPTEYIREHIRNTS